jgi:glycosyltransferase involved in cell wall biosynthesis
MDLTVPIATYNRAAILGEAIEGVLAQRLPPGVRWELVVVDNNSHDDTKAVVEHYIRTSVPVCYLFEGRQGKSHALSGASPVSVVMH